MVGGWDFQRSKFNRAVQAYRQLGSTFKPIVYTAAIDRGFTPASIIIDSPVAYPSGQRRHMGPQNYDHTFLGPITLRYARRGVAQHSGDQDDGGDRAEERARLREAVRVRGGLPAVPADRARRRRRDAAWRSPAPTRRSQPGHAHEAVVDHQREGSRRKPARAEPSGTDRRHRRRLRLRDDEHPARRAQPARHRCARRRRWRPSGRSPARPAPWTTTPTRGSSASTPTSRLASGSGSTTSGSRSAATRQGAKAALPIWMDFMQAYIDSVPTRTRRRTSSAPGNIVFLAVDKSTGAARPRRNRPGAITEAFIAGTEPGGISRTPSRKRYTESPSDLQPVVSCRQRMSYSPDRELWTSGRSRGLNRAVNFSRPKGTARSGRALPQAGRKRTGHAVDQRRRWRRA